MYGANIRISYNKTKARGRGGKKETAEEKANRPKGKQRICKGCNLLKGTHEKNLIVINEDYCLCQNCTKTHCACSGIEPPKLNAVNPLPTILDLISQKQTEFQNQNTPPEDKSQIKSLNIFHWIVTGKKLPNLF